MKFLSRLIVLGFRPLNVFSGQARHNELDGLRGWAALAVLMSHTLWNGFGIIVPALKNPVTGFLFDGRFAVFIFFVISGEALSASFLRSRKYTSLVRLAVKRYGRLTIPITVTSMLIFLIQISHINLVSRISNISGFSNFWNNEAISSYNIWPYIKYSMADVYKADETQNVVNPFLWTMHYELIGSILVVFILFCMNYLKNPWVTVVIFGALILPFKNLNIYRCFLFGSFFGYLRNSGEFDKIRIKKRNFAIVIFISMALVDGFANWKGLFWERKAIIACVLVASAWSSEKISSFLNNRISKILGVLSFPLYLMQLPVFISFTAWSISVCAVDGKLNAVSAIGLGLLSVAACIVSAALFVPVEVFTKWVGDKTVKLLVVPEKQISVHE